MRRRRTLLGQLSQAILYTKHKHRESALMRHRPCNSVGSFELETTAPYVPVTYAQDDNGSGADIPPMIFQFFPCFSHVCVTRIVCAVPLPSLSSHL